MQTNRIIITVKGGVAYIDHVPPGMAVELRDYDVEGCDERYLVKDKFGVFYSEEIREG